MAQKLVTQKCFSLQNSPKMKKKEKKIFSEFFEKLKSQKPTTPGIPRRSPIQVLTGLVVA